TPNATASFRFLLARDMAATTDKSFRPNPRVRNVAAAMKQEIHPNYTHIRALNDLKTLKRKICVIDAQDNSNLEPCTLFQTKKLQGAIPAPRLTPTNRQQA